MVYGLSVFEQFAIWGVLGVDLGWRREVYAISIYKVQVEVRIESAGYIAWIGARHPAQDIGGCGQCRVIRVKIYYLILRYIKAIKVNYSIIISFYI